MWRNWLTYPQYIPADKAELLDTAEILLTEINAMPCSEHRYSNLSDFLGSAYTNGMITKREMDFIGAEFGRQI